MTSGTQRTPCSFPRQSLVGGIVLGWTVLGATVVQGEAYRPNSDEEVLEQVPAASSGDPRLEEIRELRQRLTSLDPVLQQSSSGEEVAIAAALARRLVKFGRSEGDPRYFGYAQAALAPWWEQTEPPSEVLLLRATLRQNRHDFAGALEDLDALLVREPHNSQAWLTRAVVQQVQGRPGAALESCRPLRQLTSALIAAACEASAASLLGRGEAGYSQLQKALAWQGRADPSIRIWALTGLAEIAVRLGRTEAAEKHFSQALAESQQGPGLRDVYLLGAYGDFLLDLERFQEVAGLLRGEEAVDALLLRLALAETALSEMGMADASYQSHVTELETRFAAARRRGDETHLGNEARLRLHLLGEPIEALELALRNWQDQKEPVDARWVLEAALEAGRASEAAPVLEWIQRTGLEDPHLEALARRLREVKS
ncbi:MAG: hypothetical protein K0U98_14340 [Deltaproteobacteria bacterium]|nr:hypothetical protein [Deltaproteobacteria bacterium]